MNTTILSDNKERAFKRRAWFGLVLNTSTEKRVVSNVCLSYVGSIPTMSTKIKSVSEIKSGTQTKLIPEPLIRENLVYQGIINDLILWG